MTPEQIRMVLYALTATGFTFMVIVPFVRHRRHQRWAKIMFVRMCLAAVSWAVLGIIGDVYRSSLSRLSLWRVHHYREIIGGIWMGLLVGLAFSGQLFCHRAKQLHDAT